ncbi:MAG: nitroreductase family protein [Lacunisphaera sp.]
MGQRRRAGRWFLPKAADRASIDHVMQVALLAPSVCNRQPFEFRIFDDRALVKKVIEIPFGLAGYGHNVPVVAVVVGQQRHFFDERDRHLIYIDSSLAVMGFLLALETLGLSSCCVNWPDIESQEKEMASLLGLSPDERPVMLLAIGYPDLDGMVANSTKKSLSQLRHFNFK